MKNTTKNSTVVEITGLEGLDNKYLADLAQLWEEEYRKNKQTSAWKGYVKIMHRLGKLYNIPSDIRLHLNALAHLEQAGVSL